VFRCASHQLVKNALAALRVKLYLKIHSSVWRTEGGKNSSQYGYTLKDIAEYIGVHYTTVSRVIKKIEREDEK